MSKQLTLDLSMYLGPPKPTTYIEKYLGLTEWMQTSEAPPPFIGWWRTYTETSAPSQRRWWNGEYWSVPVYPGTSDNVAALFAACPTLAPPAGIIWCGLRKPHLAGYLEYRLVKSSRSAAWEIIHEPF